MQLFHSLVFKNPSVHSVQKRVGALLLAGCLQLLVLPPIAAVPTETSGSHSPTDSATEPMATADRLLQQGTQAYQAGQLQTAMQLWQQALTIYQTLHNRTATAQTLRNLGVAASDAKQYTDAIAYHQQALALDRELKNRPSEGYDLGNLGKAYYALGDYAKAIDYQQQALVIKRELKNAAEEGSTLNSLAGTYYAMGDYANAIAYEQQHLSITRTLHDQQDEAKALENLASAYEAMGKPEQALEMQQQRLLVAKTLHDRNLEADVLNAIGNVYANQGKNTEALEYYQRRVAMAQAMKDRSLEGKALLNVAMTYEAMGNHSAAIATFEQSLKFARELHERHWEGVVLANLGNIYYMGLQEYDKALGYLQQSAAIEQELKNDELVQAAYQQIGNIYFSSGKIAQALETLQAALTMARARHDSDSERLILQVIGQIYFQQGDYAQARTIFQDGLEAARQRHDRKGEADALTSLGAVSFGMGDVTAAIAYQEQALTTARELQDHNGELFALINLNAMYFTLSNYSKAIEYGEQGLAITEALTQQEVAQFGNRELIAQALNNLSSAYLYMGSYAKAIATMQRSLTLAQAVKAPWIEELALSNLGTIYFTLGDNVAATDYRQRSLTLARQLKDRKTEALVRSTLGISALVDQDHAKGIQYLEQSLTIAREISDHRTETVALQGLGLAYLNQDNYAKAVEYLEQGLTIDRELHDRSLEVSSLLSLGVAHFYLGNTARAMDLTAQGITIAHEIHSARLEGSGLSLQGNFLYKTGRLAEAAATLQTSIKILESLRPGLADAQQITLFDTQSSVYSLLQEVLVAQNQPEAALEVAERGRARAFAELLASRLSTTPTATPISAAPPTVAQIRQIAADHQATLVEYTIVKDTVTVAGKQQTQDTKLLIWVIQPTGTITFRQVDLTNATITPSQPSPAPGSNSAVTAARGSAHAAKVSDLVSQVRTNLRGIGVVGKNPTTTSDNDRFSFNPQPDQIQQQLRQLHRLLIDPIADLLPKNPNDRVIFIPQGSLFLVPFPALQDANNHYLIEAHTILTAPSIQVLELTQQQKRGRQHAPKLEPILVVGNPVPMPQDLEPLQGAEQEALSIARLFHTHALVRNQATKAAVVQKISQAQIIHLATHGIFDDIQGIRSKVALAPSGTDDGFLSADEILNLNLHADLVVLSACDTGRGRLTGDGVIGLSRSLVAAGVPSVIVSLWSVPDAPTASLMQGFYQELQRNPDKAQALRQTMLSTLKDYPDPLDWAAFTLIGEAL